MCTDLLPHLTGEEKQFGLELFQVLSQQLHLLEALARHMCSLVVKGTSFFCITLCCWDWKQIRVLFCPPAFLCVVTLLCFVSSFPPHCQMCWPTETSGPLPDAKRAFADVFITFYNVLPNPYDKFLLFHIISNGSASLIGPSPIQQ